MKRNSIITRLKSPTNLRTPDPLEYRWPRSTERRTVLLPLPRGEGRGEGERFFDSGPSALDSRLAAAGERPGLSRHSLVAAACLAALLPGLSVAEAADATNAPPKKHWESVASMDLALTRGNSRTFLAAASINSKAKWEKDELILGASAGYGDTTTKDAAGAEATTKTQDYLKGAAQWNHLFTKRLYGGLKLEAVHDGIADINYRFTVSPLAGYFFVKETNTFLSGELGPSYLDERLDDHTHSYLGGRVAERFGHTFDTRAKIWENAEWIPQVDKFENWILNAEAGVSAPVTKSLEVRFVAQDTYNNQPAPGRLKNDLKLLAGIGYRF